METILRASGSAEFLGLVPALAGYVPRRSLVLLPFFGARAAGAMRIDLPEASADIADYVDAALHTVAQVRTCDAIGIVVYSDEDVTPTPDGLVLPHTVMIDHLGESALDAGFRIVDALCVTPSGWSSYLDEDPQLGALDEIPPWPELPGLDVRGDQTEGVALPASDLAQRQRVGMALRDLEHVLNGEVPDAAKTPHPQALGAAVLTGDVPAFTECLIEEDADDLPPFMCAALLWCLHRPTLRDAMIVQWASDADTGIVAFGAQYDHLRRGTPTPPQIGDIFLGRAGCPDRGRLERALRAVRFAASCAPRDLRPGALVAAAWLSWALGRSSHADEYLRMALEIDPDHSLAALIQSMLAAALLPEWLLNRMAT